MFSWIYIGSWIDSKLNKPSLLVKLSLNHLLVKYHEIPTFSDEIPRLPLPATALLLGGSRSGNGGLEPSFRVGD